MGETTEVASIENLLSYNRGIKVGHDNSQLSNTFYSFYKGNGYGHQFQQGHIIYSGVGGTIAWVPNKGEIVMTKASDGSSITIMDKNLGATEVWNYGDELTSNNCGNYYQWGNDYGFPGLDTSESAITVTTTRVVRGGDGYSSSNWIYANYSSWNTDSSTSETWGGYLAPTGYHIPNGNEIEALVNMWRAVTGYTTNDGEKFCEHFMIPLAGHRNASNAAVSGNGAYAYLWTTKMESYSFRVRRLRLQPTYIYANQYSYDERSFGNSVRCFKNVTNN